MEDITAGVPTTPKVIRCISATTRFVSSNTFNSISSRNVGSASQHPVLSTNTSELDSHADTMCAGANCKTLSLKHGITVRVKPFSDDLGTIEEVPIGTAATAYVHPKTGETIILVFNEALIFGDKLKSSLINPNQMRSHGVTVSDVPKQFDIKSTHSITGLDERNVMVDLPLSLRGIISFLPTSFPTDQQLNTCRQIILTSSTEWDPYSTAFEEQENRHVSAVSSNQTEVEKPQIEQESFILSPNCDVEQFKQTVRINSLKREVNAELLPDSTLIQRMIHSVNIAADDIAGDGLTGWNDRSVSSLRSAKDRSIMAMASTGKTSALTKEILARRWGCGLESAKKTLQVTTQFGIRNVIHPYDKRYKTTFNHMRFPTLASKYYSDTMFTKIKSIRGHKMAQVFTDGKGDTHLYPLTEKAAVGSSLMTFIQDIGVPRDLVTDGAKEETLGTWLETAKKFRIRQHIAEPYSQWQNRAEWEIGELKRLMSHHRRMTNCPKRLWCYLGKWVAAIRGLTAKNTLSDSRVPSEARLGDTPDISEYAQFDWYQTVWVIDPKKGEMDKKVLMKYIGVAPNVGSLMTFWCLPGSCTPIARSSVTPLTADELAQNGIQQRIKDLDKLIQDKIGDSVKKVILDTGTDEISVPPDNIFDGDSPPHQDPTEWDPVDPQFSKPEADEFTAEAYDTYIGAQVCVPIAGELTRGKVLKRKRDGDGNPTGSKHIHHVLDTREYEVIFPDGEVNTYTANTIAENLYSNVDSEGHESLHLLEIIDHKADASAIKKDDGYITSNGRKIPRRTTIGWKLLCRWKDKSTSWVPLKDIKEAYPAQVAEYAVANKVAEEPAFSWWVRHVLRKRDRIIKKIRRGFLRKTHKYGIAVPRDVAEAKQFDIDNGNTLWMDAIEKEMKNVMCAFEFNDGNIIPIGHKKIDVKLIFDVKMMTLTRKARLVAGGHRTDPPKESVYSSVVSRESVCIAFLAAALNDLDILVGDIQNAYLNAPTNEKVYIICGLEFGSNKDRPAQIVKALYGLKSSGARFRDHLAASLRDLGFKSCKADADVWMRKNTKPDGFKYWEYCLCYVDDVLVVSHSPKTVMDLLSKKYTLKEGSVKPPDLYLGARISKHYIPGSDDPGKVRWAMSSDDYVKSAVDNVKTELNKINSQLPKNVETPLSSGYRPELDSSRELTPSQINYYQGLIGTLRWICELGRIDILMPVCLLSSYLMSPRVGHLEQALHCFAYLNKYNRSKLVFDDTRPSYDDSSFFKHSDWSEYYPDAEEPIPTNTPEARGNSVHTSAFVDADHAGCKVTRRSHTGIIIFVNRAPIVFFSKRQNTVESSTFGSEFIAMKQSIDLIEALRYKLRMMGFPMEGPTSLFCDNSAVVINTTTPESTLKRKHTSIAYHRCREAQAAGIVQITKEGTQTNLADMLTKLLAGPKLRDLAGRVLW